MELPEGRMALLSHWVYKMKCNGAGHVKRFTARLVNGGNHQISGINIQDMYAQTSQFSHAMLGVTITMKYDLKIDHMDQCMDLSGVDLQEEIYIHPA